MLKHASNAVMLVTMMLLWLPGIAALGLSKIWPDPLPPLIGVMATPPSPEVNLETVASGELQRHLAKSFPDYMPYYDGLSRLFNSVQYELLRLSSNKAVVVGKDDYLHNPSYIAAYCTRDLEASGPAIEAWAGQLAEIQSIIEGRGQQFIYVLTPSKAEEIPDTLPLGYPCNSPDKDTFIDVALERLVAEGVNYVDAREHVGEVFDRYGYEPFPKGGIHWTQLTAIAAVNDVATLANQLFGRRVLSPLEVEVEPAQTLAPDDVDYVTLMNLAVPPRPNPTAKVIYPPAGTNCPAPPISITAVGGSFFTAIGRALAYEACSPLVRNISYLVIAQVEFRRDVPDSLVDPIDYSVLDKSDLIIVEENAGIFLNTRHIPSLLEFLKTGEIVGATRY